MKVRLLAFAYASKYYIFYTVLSFVALCGGPGLHWLLTFWWLEWYWLPGGEEVRIGTCNIFGTVMQLVGGWYVLQPMFIGFWMFFVFHKQIQEAYSPVPVCTTAYNCMIWGLYSGSKDDLMTN